MSQPDLWGGPTVADVSLEEQIAAVERELTMRRSVYPRWCSSGRMTQANAAAEILRMEAVLETLRKAQRGGFDDAPG